MDLTSLHTNMPHVMLAWLLAGIAALALDAYHLWQDNLRLLSLDPLAAKASAADPAGKIRVSLEYVKWADAHPKANMARWIYTIHNTVRAGNQPDASAITDSIWSQERERHMVFRFFGKNAILLGLLFTSVGLCLTLTGVGPALAAPSGDFEVWKQGVQTAMVDALQGMAVAFYSSLYGIGITLILHFLALLLVTWRHERYLADLDGFIQGSLIPIFSIVVEKDRNDVIVEAMERTEKAFERVREQYVAVIDDARAQREELRELRIDFGRASEQLMGAVTTFGFRTEVLNEAADKMQQTHAHITQAIEDGLERLDTAQSATMDEFSKFQAKVIVPFAEQVSTQFTSQQDMGNSLLTKLSDATESFEELAGTMRDELRELGRSTSAVSQASERMATEVSNAMVSSGEAIQKLAGGQETFLLRFDELNHQQTAALAKSAEDQEKLFLRIEEIVASFSISGEGVQRQLAEVYELHRQAVSTMYEQISEVLSEAMKGVVERSNDDMARHLSEGVQRAVQDTHDRLTGLDVAFREIATAQQASAQAMGQISQALEYNEELLTAEMNSRRNAIDEALTRMSAAAAGQLALQGRQAVDQFVEQVTLAFNDSLNRQERIVTDLNRTVGRKWDDLLTAYAASGGVEVAAP